MYNKVTNDDVKALVDILGSERVIVGDDINPDYGHDELGGITHMPEVLVRVSTTEEISKVMKHAYKREIPVTVRGSGTGLVGSAVPIMGGILMETSKMNKILELDRDNLTVKAPAGRHPHHLLPGDLRLAHQPGAG